MNVRHIRGRASADAMQSLSELTELASSDRLKGWAFVAEIEGDSAPKFGAVGSFYSDPLRGLGALTRLRLRLERVAEWSEQFRRSP